MSESTSAADLFPFLSNPDISERNEETKRTGIIAGSVVGVVILIVSVLSLLIACACMTRRKKDAERHSLEMNQTKEIAKTERELIIKNKSPAEVKEYLAILREEFTQVLKSTRTVTDAGDEEDVQKRKYLIDFLHSLPPV